jgi:hypothetical protein
MAIPLDMNTLLALRARHTEIFRIVEQARCTTSRCEDLKELGFATMQLIETVTAQLVENDALRSSQAEARKQNTRMMIFAVAMVTGSGLAGRFGPQVSPRCAQLVLAGLTVLGAWWVMG